MTAFWMNNQFTRHSSVFIPEETYYTLTGETAEEQIRELATIVMAHNITCIKTTEMGIGLADILNNYLTSNLHYSTEVRMELAE